MTPLKALILKAIKQHGPLSDMDIFSRIGDEETTGFAALVVVACLDLQQSGFIEPCPSDLHTWQLSNKGLEFVAALRKADEEKLPLPPVEITADGPPVMRRYLVLEIRGGDPHIAKSWYHMAELDLEHLEIFLTKGILQEFPARARKNPPRIIVHKPAEVEA
jgi:hypothetical protein